MNIRHVVNLFGLLLLVFAGVMLALAAAYLAIQTALGHDVQRTALVALAMSAAIGALVGGLLWVTTRRGSKIIARREALLLVALSWVLGAAFAALPSFIWAHLSEHSLPDQPFRSYVNCYFEAMSGLTTTGATILTDIEAIPRSLLLWRAMTQWLGGLGIVVLFVAVLPSLGVGGKKLYRVEATGPTKEGLQPQIRDTARALWYIYLTLTLAEVVALRVAGMPWFDSLCHTFTSLATAGFSTRNASVGAYDETSVRLIVMAFMVLAGANFGLYYQLLRRRVGAVLGDIELRLYLLFLLVGSGLIFVAILNHPITSTTGPPPMPLTVGNAVMEATFTAVSIQTTTGYVTSDYNDWPFLAHAVLILMMFVGGSAGSTSGGIKVIRVWIALKVMAAEIERVFRPNVVRTLKVGGAKIDPELRLGTIAYVLGILILFGAGSVAIMLLEQTNQVHTCDYSTAASASLSTLCTVGPGLHYVGPTYNYDWFTDATKGVLCVLMALGRLEVFAIIVLFTPRFWHGD